MKKLFVGLFLAASSLPVGFIAGALAFQYVLGTGWPGAIQIAAKVAASLLGLGLFVFMGGWLRRSKPPNLPRTVRAGGRNDHKRILPLVSAFVPTVFAANKQQNGSYDTALMIAVITSLIVLAYAGNRWRLWYWGFRIGDASGSDFVSAMKWSLIAAVVVIASFSVAGLFK
ncbi:hypothetical protein N5K55_00360 [Pseudomonas aeruginosa]|nr:hypothetical protein [Pseudomonas aeruginosa]